MVRTASARYNLIFFFSLLDIVLIVFGGQKAGQKLHPNGLLET